ncbi:uncharacterized protein LOC112539314 [Tetranychus urticae]|nr:uncharacterized protein LOC112539314 [Tetranychus urticae]
MSELCGRSQGAYYPLSSVESWIAAASVATSLSPSSGLPSNPSGGISSSSPATTLPTQSASSISINGNSIANQQTNGAHSFPVNFKAHPGSVYPNYFLNSTQSLDLSTGSLDSVSSSLHSSHYINPLFGLLLNSQTQKRNQSEKQTLSSLVNSSNESKLQSDQNTTANSPKSKIS